MVGGGPSVPAMNLGSKIWVDGGSEFNDCSQWH